MLRIYCLQERYNASDPSPEKACYDMQSIPAFCDLNFDSDGIPDETTILTSVIYWSVTN